MGEAEVEEREELGLAQTALETEESGRGVLFSLFPLFVLFLVRFFFSFVRRWAEGDQGAPV